MLEGAAGITTYRGVDQGIFVRHAVGVAATVVTRSVAGVIPCDRDLAGGGIERNLRVKLAVRPDVIIHSRRVTPGCTVIIRVAQINVGVVALRRLLRDIDEVKPAVVRAARAIPREPGLGINRAPGLGGDVIKSAYVGRLQHLRGSETLRPEAVRIERAEDGCRTFAASRILKDDKDLAIGADRRIPEITGPICSRDFLRGRERADPTEPRDRGAARLDGPVKRCP